MKLTVCLLMITAAAWGAPADVSGAWILHLVAFGEETNPARVELKVDGDKVTGTLNELKLEGTLEGEALRLRATRPDGAEFATLEGRLTGMELRGTAKHGDQTMDWVARRVPPPVSAPPQTRTFEPSVFHRYFSGTIAPALHVNPGDTVRTTTVDAGGRDAKGLRRSNGGNRRPGRFTSRGPCRGIPWS